MKKGCLGAAFLYFVISWGLQQALTINREMINILYRKLGVWLCLILCLAGHLMGQKLSYRQFSVNEGLAASTVYGMVQDLDGYLWLATENGVSRFNGYEFENFTVKDGLPGNEVLKIHLDSQGRIWFFSYNGKVGYYDHGKFYHPGNQSSLSECQVSGYFLKFFEDKWGNIWLATTSLEIFKIDLNGKVEIYHEHHGLPFEGRVILFYQNKKEETIAFIKTGQFLNLTDGETYWKEEGIKTRMYGDRLEDGSVLVDYDQEIYMVSDSFNGLVSQLKGVIESQITNVEASPGQGVRIMTWSGAYWFKDNSLDPNNVQVFLKDLPVSSFLEDREGNYWVATLGQGVFVTHPRKSLLWDQEVGFQTNAVNAIGIDKEGLVWVGFDRGRFGYLRGKEYVPVELDSIALEGYSRSRARCNSIVQCSNGDLLIGFDNFIALKREGGEFELVPIPTKGLSESREGVILIGSSQGATFLDESPDWQDFHERGSWVKKRSVQAIINKMVEGLGGEIYVGTNVGLRKLENDSLYRIGSNEALWDTQINDLMIGNQGEVILASHGEGLGILVGNKMHLIDRTHGLSGDFCESLALDDEGSIWVGTNGGLSRVGNYLSPEGAQVTNFRVGDGLPSNDVRAVRVNGDSVWVGTEAGLSLLRISEQQPRIDIPFFVKEVSVSGGNLALQNHYNLPYHQNHLTIHYEGLYFGAPSKVRYRVKMIGIDTLWRTRTSRVADFPILPPGEYTFLVDVSTDGEHWLNEPVSISFLIEKPFWSTIWFMVSVVLLIGIVIFFFVRRRIKTIQDRADLMRKAEEYKQVALRTQMNPHFIFNSLNSIQQFIALKDEKSALIYLSKFSRLIRLILDHSRRGMISVSDEVNALNFYLELESLRVDGKFVYDVSIGPGLDREEAMIPGLLIQPVVENAIWHGLMPLEEGGHLHIHFARKGEMIVVMVEDNGIGRVASRKLNASKRKNHDSVGLKNLEERLIAFNREAPDKGHEIVIEDLGDDRGETNGTRVIITLYSPVNT